MSPRSLVPGLVVVLLALVALPSAAWAGATANVQLDGSLFVGAGDERNSIQVEVKPGAPRDAPTTLRVRDTFEPVETPGPDSGCVKTGSGLESTYLECQVTVARVDLLLGGGDDNGEVMTGNGPIQGLLYGVDGQDTLIGGGATDILQGGPGIDDLRGGGGNDELYGQETEDKMDGQEGSDLYVGGPGGDSMVDSGTAGVDTVTYFDALAGVRVTVDDSAANDGENGGFEGDSVGAGFERIQGSAFADVIEGGPLAETINGSKGDDDLDGKGGADTVEGNEGEDTLRARDGAADALLDCDSASSETQGTRDKAIVDAAGVDPDPVRCESVERPATATPPTSGGGGGTGGGDRRRRDRRRHPAPGRAPPGRDGAPGHLRRAHGRKHADLHPRHLDGLPQLHLRVVQAGGRHRAAADDRHRSALPARRGRRGRPHLLRRARHERRGVGPGPVPAGRRARHGGHAPGPEPAARQGPGRDPREDGWPGGLR